MQAPGGRIVVNPTFQNWEYEDDKPTFMTPMKRQITYRVEEEIDPTGTKEDPWKQNDSRGGVDYGAANPAQGSNRTVLTLLSFVCLMSIAALALTILMLFGKIGCGRCSTNEASPESLAVGSDSDILAKIKALEENVTSLQLGLEKKNSELKDVRSSLKDLEEKCSDLSVKLNMTATKLQTTDSMIYDRIGNVTTSILYKVHKSYLVFPHL
ncbi:hypothetical protein ACROYT_G041049 [Oculina patagonica]